VETTILKFTNKNLGKVRGLNIDGEPLFVGKDVAEALGYKDTADAIKKHVEIEDKMGRQIADSQGRQQNTTIINESGLYSLIFGSKLPSAKEFKKWVTTEVLPSIRKHGVYLGDNADVDYINNELRFSTGRVIKTFGTAKPSEIKQLYSEFKTYTDEEYKYDTDKRISRYKSVEKGLTTLHNNIAKQDIGNIGDCYNINKFKEQVILDRTKLEKKSLGGDKGAKTKEIKQLQEKIDNTYPKDDEFVTLNYHGFSCNYMYKYSNDGTYKTDANKILIKHFPIEQVPNVDYWKNVDFSKPIELFINYVVKSENDIQNNDKSFIDMLFNNILHVDDNIVESIHSKRVGTIDNFQDGKISFFIRNKRN
jgi:prophage antirepressor-like protein